jgi:hypothetical protein
MEKKLNFVKLAGRWFVRLSDYPGHYSDLEMVLGADVMCDMIDTFETGNITVTVSDEPFDSMFSTREYILDFVNSTTSNGEQDGANYRMREYKLDVWLCNVTKYVFGEFPATIYIVV